MNKRTVLIVDNSPIMLYYHSILMKRLQYAVLTARIPDDAQRLMDQIIPSLILTGTTFASASGIDFIKRIKSNVHTRSVPVIVLTSAGDAATRADCLNAGCVACLNKPVEPACLFWTIQDLTERTPREYVRIQTSVKTIAGDGDARGDAARTEYATNLSEGGLYLRSLSPLPKEKLIPLRMIINDREIKAKAVVLYSIPMEAGQFKEPGMGLKFVDISEEDLNFLRNFIHDQLIADIEMYLHEVKAE